MLREVPTLEGSPNSLKQVALDSTAGKRRGGNRQASIKHWLLYRGWETKDEQQHRGTLHSKINTVCSTPLTVLIKATASSYFVTVLVARNARGRPRAEGHQRSSLLYAYILKCLLPALFSFFLIQTAPSLHIYSSLPQSYKSTLQT